MAALSVFGFAALAAWSPEASAHGWHRHGHRHHQSHHRHHRGWVHDHGPRHYYGPRYRWVSISPFAWSYGCGLRRFITSYGALAYREVCD